MKIWGNELTISVACSEVSAGPCEGEVVSKLEEEMGKRR